MHDRVTVEVRDGVADVRLNRPSKMNAIDNAMFTRLIEVGEMLVGRAGLRAVILSGQGPAFCAGLDVDNLQAMAADGDGARAISRSVLPAHRTAGGSNRAQHAVMVWREIPVPVIAAVHGVAVGGGFQLALGADVRFVTPDVKLSALEIKWGLIPDMAGFLMMRRLVRDDIARELTYSGRILRGIEALHLGLASRVCDDPKAEADTFAREIAGRSPHAIRAAKRLLNLSAEASQSQLLLSESREQAALIGSHNQIEAVNATLAKRPPEFIEV